MLLWGKCCGKAQRKEYDRNLKTQVCSLFDVEVQCIEKRNTTRTKYSLRWPLKLAQLVHYRTKPEKPVTFRALSPGTIPPTHQFTLTWNTRIGLLYQKRVRHKRVGWLIRKKNNSTYLVWEGSRKSLLLSSRLWREKKVGDEGKDSLWKRSASTERPVILYLL